MVDFGFWMLDEDKKKRMNAMKTLTIFAFALLSPLQGQIPIPAEALELKEQRDAKVAEIDKALVNELSKLREKYTQTGERDKAAAVTGLIDEATPQEAIIIDTRSLLAPDRPYARPYPDSSAHAATGILAVQKELPKRPHPPRSMLASG